MHTRRVYRKLRQKKDESGWQVSWLESPAGVAMNVELYKEKQMKKRSSPAGCMFGIFLLFLLLIGGGFLWLRTRSAPFDGSPPSSVMVTLGSPTSGEEVFTGEYISVTAQAVAPTGITSMELFVDGKPFGSPASSTSTAAWTWQAWPPGIHTFSARATDSTGQTGSSQTVILNVLAADSMQVNASEGQTLTELGSQFGASPEEMIASNPNLDPLGSLPDGQPVNIPVEKGAPGGGSAPGGGQGNGLEFIPIYITWTFTPLQPVDNSYCYTSTGDGIWEKMPKPPFSFLDDINPYTQFDVIFPKQTGVIQVQCWGWLSGILKFLGQGESKFDVLKPPAEVTISGEGFVLNGLPIIPPIEEDKFLAGGNDVPPPYALREPQTAADCTAHGHPILAPFICDTLLNAKMKEYIILEWEWAPKVCWGECPWYDEIDGYRLYEIDPATKSKKFIKEIKPFNQKVTAVPLPWGAKCYGIEAFIASGGISPSDMSTYCPGTPPSAQKITLTPVQWLTTGGQWIQDGGCDDYGGADSYKLQNQNSGFGNQSGQVLVGSYIVDDDDCYREGNYSAGIKFDLVSLPPYAVIQHAELRFSKIFMDYGATGLAAPKPQSCVKNIGKAKKDWSALGTGIHFDDDISLSSSAYNTVLTSVSSYSNQADVTQAATDWLKNPFNNHGFIFTPASAPHPIGDGSGECLSGLGNFQLDVYYFAP